MGAHATVCFVAPQPTDELDAIERHFNRYRNRIKERDDMNIDNAFPSKWIRASDIKGREVNVTIAAIGTENFQDGSSKPTLHFVGKDKGMVLNRVNATMIAEVYGPETDAWVGKSVTLYTMLVQGPSGMTDGIRVRIAGGQTAIADPAGDQAKAEAVPELDDDTPF